MSQASRFVLQANLHTVEIVVERVIKKSYENFDTEVT